MNYKIAYVLILFMLGMNSVTGQPVKVHGKLQVKGKALLDEKGDTVVLRGMSYGWHNWWSRFYNAETVQWLRDDWNCTVLRAAMGVEPDSGYMKMPDWSLEKLYAVVDAAILENIYVLIDWHSHGLHTKEAKVFFTNMAKKYGNYPHVIYEIYNEPLRQSWPKVKAYSEEIIKAIREFDPDNIILVGSPHWDQDIHLVADNPILGAENIMYTVHFYAAEHKDFLRERCDYAINKNIPIFVSECAGMSANGDGPLNMPEWNIWVDFMEENKISWITWSVADKNESCSVLLPSASSYGKWNDDDIKEWGITIREYFRKYNQ